MSSSLLRLAPLLSLVLVVACSDKGTTEPVSAAPPAVTQAESSEPQLPCAIDRIFAERCRDCHAATPLYGAPNALVTMADLQRKTISESDRQAIDVALDRVRSGKDPMPPPPRARLTIEELDALDTWAASGAPARAKGEVCDAKPPPSTTPAACEPSLRLKPASRWTMPKATADEYVCYGVELGEEPVKRQITGIVPFIDNPKIVHHLLLLQADKAESPVPHPCDAFSVEWKAIYAWAPGAPAYNLPEAAGFPVKENQKAHYVVQVHYSNLAGLEGEQDGTEMGLCMADKPRPYDADIMWVGGSDFKLPPHKTSTIECSLPFSTSYTFLPIHVFQAWPHMHKLGTRLESDLIRPDGSKISLGVANPFRFEDQAALPVSAEVYPGDRMVTRCTWDNTTNEVVKFGEATSEEMCFNLLAYYPKINLPQFGSPAAAFLSECKAIP